MATVASAQSPAPQQSPALEQLVFREGKCFRSSDNKEVMPIPIGNPIAIREYSDWMFAKTWQDAAETAVVQHGLVGQVNAYASGGCAWDREIRAIQLYRINE